MKLTIERAKAMMKKNGGYLDLSGTQITSLGDNLKEKYTIREAIELTRGKFNANRFAEFFGVE